MSSCDLLITIFRQLSRGRDVAVISEQLPNASIDLGKNKLFLRNLHRSSLLAIRVDTVITVGTINESILNRINRLTGLSGEPERLYFSDN